MNVFIYHIMKEKMSMLFTFPKKEVLQISLEFGKVRIHILYKMKSIVTRI